MAQRLGNYVPKSGGYANTNIYSVRSTPYTQDLAENLEIASTLIMHDYGTCFLFFTLERPILRSAGRGLAP